MRQCAERIRKVSAERINVELSKLILGSSADKVLQEFGDIIKIAAPGLRAVSVCHAQRNYQYAWRCCFQKRQRLRCAS